MSMNDPIIAPILFIIFNNATTARKVFDVIRSVKPKRLFVFCDGPRPSVAGEKEKCLEAQSVATQVDWDCELRTLFLEDNLGSRNGVARGIDWFFENVDEGMILEHDCLPSKSFFWFCQEMLSRYRDDARVMHVCGGNYQGGIERGDSSYYFSRYPQIWGWATWKRAWKYYDVDMKGYEPFLKNQGLESLFRLRAERRFWKHNFEKTISREINTVWDFQWVFSVLTQNGLSITPNKNLVSNIGFGEGALHMSYIDKKTANLPIHELDAITHPGFMVADVAADAVAFRNLFTLPPTGRAKVFLFRARRKLRKILGRLQSR
jgi:hypothetical protein